MNNQKVFLLLAIFFLVGGAIYFLPSDEKKIRNNLDSLAEYCSSVKEEPVMETMKKVALATKLFTDPCKVHIEPFKVDREFSHKEISDQFLMLKKKLSDTRFSFQDTAVDIPDGGRAEVITTLRFDGESIDGQFTDAYEINIIVDKQDSDWRFTSFTVVEFMKK